MSIETITIPINKIKLIATFLGVVIRRNEDEGYVQMKIRGRWKWEIEWGNTISFQENFCTRWNRKFPPFLPFTLKNIPNMMKGFFFAPLPTQGISQNCPLGRLFHPLSHKVSSTCCSPCFFLLVIQHFYWKGIPFGTNKITISMEPNRTSTYEPFNLK